MNGVTNETKPDQKIQEWIHARRRHHLSHAQVQMARELGMSPMKLGKLDNHEQEPWKMPLREYIEHLYLKRFGSLLPITLRPSSSGASTRGKRKRGAQPGEDPLWSLYETIRR